MAEENPRSRGTVLWFDDQKCYGFISPEDGGEDLFVHQSEIKSDAFRTLHEGQVVEFFIALENDRTKAIDVTGPDGSSIEKIRQDGRGGIYGFRSNGGGGGGCYNCGESGHLARDCRVQVNSGGGGGGGCYNCGDCGHLARDCYRGRGGGGRGGGGCYTCGGQGHMARDCPSGGGGSGRFGGGGGGGGSNCFNCGEVGHFARECSNSAGP